MNNIADLRQHMNVMISTYFHLFGFMPDIKVLSDALGSEYKEVLEEYRVLNQ